ncbi:C40 family peptidase [Streptomyces roseirectus]|uniref:C40 family peptidase n=2 Tax=Streptomyces roseirectus TaxID=2768066 RepID=A0A7H0ISM0_9ACTN|nr:C40 family peptidase [Streptomyces roseirectus]
MGMRASGISTPALATAALTSMAMLSQPAAEAAPPTDDGRPSLEDVERKLDAFYSQTGSRKDIAAKEKETKRAKTFLDASARYRAQEPLLPPPPALPPLPAFPPSVAHDFAADDFTAAPQTRAGAPRGHEDVPERLASYTPGMTSSILEAFPEAVPDIVPEVIPEAAPEFDTDFDSASGTEFETDPESDLKYAKAAVQGKLSKAQALLSFHTAGQPKATHRPKESAPISAEAERALAFAREQLGKPVVLGAAGPGSFDGPGLTQTAWKSAGVALPRTTFGQVTAGTPIRLPDARPGDLIFFHDAITHVGIYIGEGRMIHAPRPGAYICEESIHFAGTSEIHSVVRPA